MNKYQTLHETPIRTILDLINLARDVDGKDIFNKAQRSPYASTSIARITNDMTLVFPVMVSSSLHIDTAIMVSKAIERKCVSMLQILFSAFQVTDAKDAKELLSRFHSNIKLSGKASVDDFIALGDAIGESGRIKVDHSRIAMLSEDFRQNCFFVLEGQSIAPTSIATQYSGITPIQEVRRNPAWRNNYNASQHQTAATIQANSRLLQFAIRDPETGAYIGDSNRLDSRRRELELQRTQSSIDQSNASAAQSRAQAAYVDRQAEKLGYTLNAQYPGVLDRIRNGTATPQDYEFANLVGRVNQQTDQKKIDSANLRKIEKDIEKTELDIERMKDPIEKEKRQLEVNKLKADIEKIRTGQAKDLSDIARNEVDFFNKQILSGDIKKANELQPVTMVMSFKHLDSASGRTTEVENVVIGVKARLVPVDSADIINHIITKLDDHQFVFNLVRATTREISFMKDFIFALDKAKIEALANSHRGSANPMWKVLERRALMSRIKRTVGIAGNNANAITSLVLSQEEVDYVRNNYSRDLSSAREASVILDSYNFLSIVIADESLEVCKFLFDTGEAMWETLPFNALEREAQDNSYKKIVNLMSKIS